MKMTAREPCQLQQRKDFFLRGLTRCSRKRDGVPEIWWCVSSPASSEAGKRWTGKPADVASPVPGPQCHLRVQCHGHLLAPVRSTSFLTAREHTKHFPLRPGHAFCSPALSLPVASLWSLKYLLCDYWRITLHSVSWEDGEKKNRTWNSVVWT